MIIIKENDNMHDGFGYVTAKSLDEVDPKKIAKDGINEAISKIGGKSIASGKYKTIINKLGMKDSNIYTPTLIYVKKGKLYFRILKRLI